MSAAIGTGTVHAAGTASGTPISNLSTLNYSVGGMAQPAIGSSPTGNTSGAGTATTFVVDNRVNVTVVTTDAAVRSVVPGATAQVTTFTVTNTGNTVQDFALDIGASSQRPDAVRCHRQLRYTGVRAVCRKLAAPPVIRSGNDTATFIDELAADASRTVYVVCDIPVSARQQRCTRSSALIATARAGGSAGGSVGAVLTQAPAPTPPVSTSCSATPPELMTAHAMRRTRRAARIAS